jgi:enoyl-CoA hydratase/carnithine racemase
MSTPITPFPPLVSQGQVLAQVHGRMGLLTLNRPGALNALSLAMVRDLSTVLLQWRQDPTILAVVLQGTGREGKPPAFCAGGDIRFFHQAALAGDPRLEDFFTEEYALNHLIHRFPKPVIAWMDGVCMGGGMGLAQGAGLRVVSEHSKLAMPETNIGLFPDVGGGWFLARCPGHLGEFLALTGQVLQAADAMAVGLADICVDAAAWPAVLDALGDATFNHAEQAVAAVRARASLAGEAPLAARRPEIDLHFSRDSVAEIEASLAQDRSAWAQTALHALRKQSPLMMAVALEQVRRARQIGLGEALRMERDLVRQCFHLRPGTASETVEGIRALVVDKDHQPRWNPPHIADLQPEMIEPFFSSPWPAHSHPLRELD